MLFIRCHIDAKIILLKQIHSYLLLASLLPHKANADYYFNRAHLIYKMLIESISTQRDIYESDTIDFNVINFNGLQSSEDEATNTIRKAS